MGHRAGAVPSTPASTKAPARGWEAVRMALAPHRSPGRGESYPTHQQSKSSAAPGARGEGRAGRERCHLPAPGLLQSLPAPRRVPPCGVGTSRGHGGRLPVAGGPVMRLTGFAAIEYAEKEGLRLNKAADRIDEERAGLTVAEAEAVAAED